jgi:hypothetical protein
MLKRRIWTGAAVAALAIGVAACGSSGGGASKSDAGSAKPASDSASTAAPAPTAAAPAPVSAPKAGTQSASIPEYQPSSVISRSPGHVQLSSPDSVTKVGDFYKQALDRGGWHISSDASSPYSVNLVAQRSSEGATVAIASTGRGASISVSDYGR